MTYLDIFLEELKRSGISWCQGCDLYSSHKRGFAVQSTRVVHLDSAIATRRSLHRGLHEIGHLVNDERGMKRFEKEAAANWYAENRMRELGIPVPRAEAAKGRMYVSRMKRWGKRISDGRESS